MPTPFLRALAQAPAAPVLPVALGAPGAARLDFTAANPRLARPEALRDTAAFAQVVQQMLADQHAATGLGGYLENRVIYRRSPHFGGPGAARSLHLGVDVWVPAGTPVAAPLPAVVHSVADNAGFGDYGPTVVLAHALAGTAFYSLYGHLGRADWLRLRPDQALAAGETFAAVGPYPENGDWPPHLHFQLITDMQGRRGDFPGVARVEERDYWAALCPDPNLLLRAPALTAPGPLNRT